MFGWVCRVSVFNHYLTLPVDVSVNKLQWRQELGEELRRDFHSFSFAPRNLIVLYKQHYRHVFPHWATAPNIVSDGHVWRVKRVLMLLFCFISSCLWSSMSWLWRRTMKCVGRSALAGSSLRRTWMMRRTAGANLTWPPCPSAACWSFAAPSHMVKCSSVCSTSIKLAAVWFYLTCRWNKIRSDNSDVQKAVFCFVPWKRFSSLPLNQVVAAFCLRLPSFSRCHPPGPRADLSARHRPPGGRDDDHLWSDQSRGQAQRSPGSASQTQVSSPAGTSIRLCLIEWISIS